MHKSLSTVSLAATLLFGASLCLAKTPPKYFFLQSIGHEINTGHFSGFDQSGVVLVDPATTKDMSQTVSCSINYNTTVPNSVGGLPSSEWVTSDQDPNWACRMDSYISATEFRMGIRHQYRRNGLPCLKANGPECVTRLGYVDFNSSAPGYTLYDTSKSNSPGASGELLAYAGPFNIPVYQHCLSCASNKVGVFAA